MFQEHWTTLVGAPAVNWIIRSAIGSLLPNFNHEKYTQEASTVFVEYPETVDFPRPRGLDTVYVGCSCKLSGKPLPTDLENFVNDPKSKGTILVAFGTLGNWVIAPKRISAKFFKALGQLTDYRILFNYRGDPTIFGSHIKAMKWLPQTDILLHEKTKLFISHGGLKSFKETVCAGIPVLYLPLFAEQLRNALAAEVYGFGLRENKLTFETESFVTKIREILENDVYRRNIEKVRRRWLDHPIPQLNEGVFWAEYIIRHGGMPKIFHRRSMDMYWFQHWCLDVTGALIIGSLLALLLSYKAFRNLFWLIGKKVE